MEPVIQLPVLVNFVTKVDILLRREIQPRIQLSIPHMGDYELQYVEEAFRTNWIAPLGPNVDAFEKELASYLGAGHGAALSSGTSAIHLALRLLEVGSDAADDVRIVQSRTDRRADGPAAFEHCPGS